MKRHEHFAPFFQRRGNSICNRGPDLLQETGPVISSFVTRGLSGEFVVKVNSEAAVSYPAVSNFKLIYILYVYT